MSKNCDHGTRQGRSHRRSLHQLPDLHPLSCVMHGPGGVLGCTAGYTGCDTTVSVVETSLDVTTFVEGEGPLKRSCCARPSVHCMPWAPAAVESRRSEFIRKRSHEQPLQIKAVRNTIRPYLALGTRWRTISAVAWASKVQQLCLVCI